MHHRNLIKILIHAFKVVKATEESSSCLWKRKVEIFSSKKYESLQGQDDTHGATDNLNEGRPDGFEVNTSSFLAT